MDIQAIQHKTTETINPTPIKLVTTINAIEKANNLSEHERLAELWIKAKTNLAMDLAIKEAEKKQVKMMEEMIPKELWELDVFDKDMAN